VCPHVGVPGQQTPSMLAREQPAPSAASVVAGVCAQSPGVAEQQANPAVAEAGLSGAGVDAR
jgi:hypothetical protein